MGAEQQDARDGRREKIVATTASWLIPAIVLAGAGAAIIDLGVPAPARSELHDYSPLEPGTSWVYETRTNGRPTGLHTSDVRGDFTIQTDEFHEAVLVSDHYEDFAGLGEYWGETYVGFNEQEQQSYGTRAYSGTFEETLPPLPELRLPLDAGETWSWEGTASGSDQRREFTLEAIEEVQIGDTTFEDCLHVVSRIPADGETGAIAETIDTWRCPGIGVVKLRDEVPSQDVVFEEELVEFHSPDRSFHVGDPPNDVDLDPASGGVEAVDPGRSNHVPDGALSDRVVWTDVRGADFRYPMVAADDGYVTAEMEGTVQVTNLADGSVKWERRVAPPVVTPPSALGELVLIADGAKRLHAFDARSGRTRWSKTFEDVVSAAPVPLGDVLVTATEDATIRGLDAATGDELWAHALDGLLVGNLAAATDRIVAFDNSGSLVALDEDGEVLWSDEVETPEVGPIVAADRVLIYDGRLKSYSLDGDLAWEELGGVPTGMAADEDSVIFVEDNELRARSLVDGDLLWESSLAGTPSSFAPVIVADDVAVPLEDGRIDVLRASSGQHLRTIDPPRPRGGGEMTPITPLAVADDALVAGLEGPPLWPETIFFAFDLARREPGISFDGEVRPATDPASGPPLIHDGNVILPTLGQAIFSLAPDGGIEPVLAGESNPLWVTAGDDLLVGYQDDRLTALRGGEPLWTFDLPDALGAPAAVTDGFVVAAAPHVALIGLDREDGSPRWTYRTPGAQSITGPMSLPDGDVAYVSDGIARLDPADGTERWRTPGVETGSPLAFAGGTIFVSGYRDNAPAVMAFDSETGEERWQVPGAPTILIGPAAGDEIVVVAEDRGKVRALDPRDGSEVWATRVQTTFGNSPMIVGDVVAVGQLGRSESVGFSLHRLSFHDAATGRYLGAFQPPGSSSGFVSMGVDEGNILIPTSTSLSPGGVMIVEPRR